MWILFKEIVNFVVMNELVAYILLAASFCRLPENGIASFKEIFGYIGGFLIVMFNIWTKIDKYGPTKDFSACNTCFFIDTYF